MIACGVLMDNLGLTKRQVHTKHFSDFFTSGFYLGFFIAYKLIEIDIADNLQF